MVLLTMDQVEKQQEIEQKTASASARLEPEVEQAFADINLAIRSNNAATDIASVVATEGVGAVEFIFRGSRGMTLQSFSDTLVPGIVRGGQITLESLPAGAVPEWQTFNLFGGNLTDEVNTYLSRLTLSVDGNSRKGIARLITQDSAANISPAETARKIEQYIGLTDPDVRAVENYRRALQDFDRSALELSLRDRRFDRTIRNAIENAQPIAPERVDRMVQRYAQRLLRHRANTIGRTEAGRVISMGEYFSMRQAQEDGVLSPNIRRIWIYTPDERTRANHRAIPSMNPDGVGINQPFNTPLGHLNYPRDPNGSPSNVINCRCRVGYKML